MHHFEPLHHQLIVDVYSIQEKNVEEVVDLLVALTDVGQLQVVDIPDQGSLAGLKAVLDHEGVVVVPILGRLHPKD